MLVPGGVGGSCPQSSAGSFLGVDIDEPDGFIDLGLIHDLPKTILIRNLRSPIESIGIKCGVLWFYVHSHALVLKRLWILFWGSVTDGELWGAGSTIIGRLALDDGTNLHELPDGHPRCARWSAR